MSKLTSTEIKNAKGKEKAYSLSDGLGLSIHINPNNTKWWRYRFQFNGKAKMMSLGTYPDIGIADARERLREARGLVARGINPIEERQNQQDEKVHTKDTSLLFKNVADAFLEKIEKDVSIHHYKRSESLIRLYATPVLGNQQMDSIGHKGIQKIIVDLADADKTESAKKLYGVLKQLFSYALVRDKVEVNVCNLIEIKEITKGQIKRKFPTITDPKKIKMLMQNIREAEGVHYSTKEALLFMAYTSLRSSNVRHAKWEQIDFEKQMMTIPKEEMKIAKKDLHNSEDFELPLSKQTVEQLTSLKNKFGHLIYIFPSIRGDRAMSENAMLVFIRSLGYSKEEFTPHGFRAMFATVANDEDNNFGHELIDAQLAHKVGGSVSQAYNRTDYFGRRKPLVQWWADWLEKL